MEKKSLLVFVLTSFLVFSVLLSLVSAYTFNDVLSGKASFSDYIKEKITGKAVVQDAEAKGFTSQGTWLKSWIPNLKSVYNGDILIGDFNGDGKTDIGVYDAIKGNWMIANSNGNGFDATGVWLKSWLPKVDYGEGDTFTGDFNGDGKTDIGVYDAIHGNWLVATSTGTGFSTKNQGWLSGWLPYGYGYIWDVFTGDFNGDGKTDIGVYDSPTGNWSVALSNGNGFDAKGTWLKSWLPKSSYGEGDIFTGDFNGDGKTDIGVYDAINGNWLVALASEPVILIDTGGVYSSGGGFTAKGTWIASWLPKSSYGEGDIFTGDFNGDGKTDIGVYDSMNGNWLTALATSTPSYCVDTDNGAVYTKKGNVYGVELGNAFDKADYCLTDTTLREYYCHGANAVISDYNCPDGCSSGICNATATIIQNQTNATCTDSDGGLNYYVIGNATGVGYTGEVNTINDGCIIGGFNDGWLREAVCKDNIATWSDYNCSVGCENGVCNSNQTLTNRTCTDSDNGQSFNTQGTATITPEGGSSTDYCSNSTTLKEFFCTSTSNIDFMNFVCSDGCDNGVCSTEQTCTDSDGGKEYYVKGEVSYGGEVFTDVCGGFLWWAELKENYCDGGIRAAEKVRCPGAIFWNSKCSDGRCIE